MIQSFHYLSSKMIYKMLFTQIDLSVRFYLRPKRLKSVGMNLTINGFGKQSAEIDV